MKISEQNIPERPASTNVQRWEKAWLVQGSERRPVSLECSELGEDCYDMRS